MKQEEQKARELVNKFKEFVNSEKNIIDDRSYYEIITSNAKQCALICVDEILKEYAIIISNYGRPIEIDKRFYFYTKVKQEINKL